MTTLPIQDVVRYFSDVNTRVLTYHNQKELLAWGAIAFYFGFGALVDACIKDNLAGKESLTALMVLVCGLLIWYVLTQLQLRRHFGRLTAVLPRICMALIAMDKQEFDSLDWSLEAIDPKKPESSLANLFPPFVCEEYRKVKAMPHFARWLLEVLPLAVLVAACIFFVCVIQQSALASGWKVVHRPAVVQAPPCVPPPVFICPVPLPQTQPAKTAGPARK